MPLLKLKSFQIQDTLKETLDLLNRQFTSYNLFDYLERYGGIDDSFKSRLIIYDYGIVVAVEDDITKKESPIALLIGEADVGLYDIIPLSYSLLWNEQDLTLINAAVKYLRKQEIFTRIILTEAQELCFSDKIKEHFPDWLD